MATKRRRVARLDMMHKVIMKNFKSLTKTQSKVFVQIATGNDAGHNRKVLDRLENMGLLTCELQQLSGFPPVAIRRYEVPITVHMEWCQWCSDNA